MAERSGNAYKARLLLSLLDIPYEKIEIDFARREHKRPEYLKLNPRGQVPVLEDDSRIIWDSTAVLVYIARKHGGETWLPTAAGEMAEVMQWMALAQNEIHYGLQFARAIVHLSRPGNLEECQAHGRTALRVLDERLVNHDWLALDRMTIADIACFPYAAMAPDANIALDEYAAIGAWVTRIQARPGYVPLPSLGKS